VTPRRSGPSGTARRLEGAGPPREICLEVEDHTTAARDAARLFGLPKDRGAQTHAARLAEQFILWNREICNLLEVSLRRDFDGSDVYVQIESRGVVGAVPLRSPLTHRFELGLVVRPRFPWPGIGAMLAETGWRVAPSPLRLPLLQRSERRVPPWVLAYMVLARLKALLDRLERRFEIATERRTAPKGRVHWTDYATRSLTRGAFLEVPCSFPDLRDDRLLKAAVRFTVERQIQSLETQRRHGSFVHRLIAFAESLLRRVQAVPPRRPSPLELDAWLRRPLRTEALLEGLQAIQWTAEERGLAGLSDLEGIPWKLPMEQFFEVWVETVLHYVARSTGAALKAARRRETTLPLHWDPPYAGSQKSLAPDLALHLEGCTVVVDAKYKRHWEEIRQSEWSAVPEEIREQHRHDLLQVLAYGAASDSPLTVCCLAYPCSLKTWRSLAARGRLFDQAEIPVAARRLQLWLTAVPMHADVPAVAAPWIRKLAETPRPYGSQEIRI
jgi:5-methylcytosine-specific restriction endonuclease McrBC regulatory subunit McrC